MGAKTWMFEVVVQREAVQTVTMQVVAESYEEAGARALKLVAQDGVCADWKTGQVSATECVGVQRIGQPSEQLALFRGLA